MPDNPSMTITFDLQTATVSYKCDSAAVSFWQMIVGEVVRQLEDHRQAINAMAIRNKMIEEAKNAEIAAMLANKSNPTRFGPG